MKRREFLISTGIAASAGATFGPLAHAQGNYKPEYRMSTVLGPAFAWGRAADQWAKLVGQATQGRVVSKVYPGASLVQGDATKELSAMRQGSIDLVCGAPGNWIGAGRSLGCFSLPFQFPDHKAWDAVMNHKGLMQEYFEVARKAGVEPLALGETGFRQLSNSKRPVRRPEDLKGLKIRLPPSPMMSETLQELGGNPTVMSWADTQPALASGAIDGVENPMELFFAAKMNTLGQKYVTRWNYMNEVLLFGVSKSAWDSWSPQDQKLVRDAAIEAARLNVQEVRNAYAEDIANASKLGVEVVQPTAAELNAFVVATRRTYARWKAQINPTIVSAIEQIVADSRKG